MTDQVPNKHIAKLKNELEGGKLDRREFVRLAALMGLAAPAAYALAESITGQSFAPAATAGEMPKGGTVRVGTRVKEIKDPHTYSWGGYDSNISRQVAEYLSVTDENNITKPLLLEKWSVSDDLKTWTLNIRKGVKWRNGQDLTADQVIWNIKRCLDPEVGSSVIGLMEGYMLEKFDTGQKDEKTGKNKMSSRLWSDKAIEKVDDLTIRINCKVPQIAVPEHLFHYPLAILHPDEKGVFGVGSQGTGPFELVEFEVGKKAVLKSRKSGYWGEPANIDQLEFIDLGDDPAAGIAALASKQVDGLVWADPVQYDALKAIPHLAMYQVKSGETAVLRMKVTEKPFDNPKVRIAMRLAVEPQTIVDIALRGLGVPGEHHHVSEAQPEYAKLPAWKRDVPAAKKLLSEAGFPNGIDSEIYVPKDLPWIEAQAAAAVEQWKEAGIRIKINAVPGAQYWDVWTKVPVGATIWYHRPLGVMILGLAYRTGVPWNETGYSNPEFDKLLGEAEGILDVDKRREVMAKLEKIMQEDGPIVQPIFRNGFTFYDKKVLGYKMHPSNYFITAKTIAVQA